jgi:hypothetical protein
MGQCVLAHDQDQGSPGSARRDLRSATIPAACAFTSSGPAEGGTSGKAMSSSIQSEYTSVQFHLLAALICASDQLHWGSGTP